MQKNMSSNINAKRICFVALRVRYRQIEQTKQKCSFSTLEKIFQDKKNRNFKKLLINSQKEKK